MTISNGYTTVDEFKARYYPADMADAIDDAVIEAVVEATSRLIDEHCSRRFWKNTVAEARYYTPEWGDLLIVDDLVSVTSLKTDEDEDRTYERTWTTADYDLEPYNAGLSSPVKPYTQIRTSPKGSYSFPGTRKGVELTGIFGWYAVPDAINEACLIQSIRLFKRKDTPFGIAGNEELGTLQNIPRLDPDVKMLLEPYRRITSVGDV